MYSSSLAPNRHELLYLFCSKLADWLRISVLLNQFPQPWFHPTIAWICFLGSSELNFSNTVWPVYQKTDRKHVRSFWARCTTAVITHTFDMNTKLVTNVVLVDFHCPSLASICPSMGPWYILFLLCPFCSCLLADRRNTWCMISLE